jgi:uncharacterized protein DUF6527
VRLTDLNPRFIGAGGPGVFKADGSPAPRREGVGLMCDCPCGQCGEFGLLFVAFANPLDGGEPIQKTTWKRTGETFETLTLEPSILRSSERGGCGWHGFITNGEVTSC